MGNRATILKCFETLCIPERSHKAFERKVLDYISLHSPAGNDLPGAPPKAVKEITRDFVQSEQFRKFQHQPHAAQTLHAQPSEGGLHTCLLELVNIWLEEKRRQESQQDPSYSQSSTVSSVTPKKRKRVSQQQSRLNSDKERAGKRSAVRHDDTCSASGSFIQPISISTYTENHETNTNPPRSATIQRDSGSREDIEHYSLEDSDDDSDSLPHLQQILNDRPQRRNNEQPNLADNLKSTSVSHKGKAPVTDLHASVSVQMDSTDTPGFQSTVRNSGISGDSLQDRAPSGSHSLRDPLSQTVEAEVQASSLPRQHRSIIDIEEAEDKQNDEASPSITSHTSITTPTKQRTSMTRSGTNARSTPEPTSTILTPPPTVRRSAFSNSIFFGPTTPTPHPAVNTSRTNDDRDLNLVNCIKDYIRQCQEHSTSMAETSSSERERQRYRHRAVAFAELEGDIESRIKAFVEEESGAVGTGTVRSLCLWS